MLFAVVPFVRASTAPLLVQCAFVGARLFAPDRSDVRDVAGACLDVNRDNPRVDLPRARDEVKARCRLQRANEVVQREHFAGLAAQGRF